MMGLRIAISIPLGLVFTVPIAFWMLLNRYYGRIPQEATLFGMNLRVVLAVVSGTGLFLLIGGNIVISLLGQQQEHPDRPSDPTW